MNRVLSSLIEAGKNIEYYISHYFKYNDDSGIFNTRGLDFKNVGTYLNIMDSSFGLWSNDDDIFDNLLSYWWLLTYYRTDKKSQRIRINDRNKAIIENIIKKRGVKVAKIKYIIDTSYRLSQSDKKSQRIRVNDRNKAIIENIIKKTWG